jgi:hypothetical protein
VKPSLEEIMPLYPELFPRHKKQGLIKTAKVKFSWRTLTPLVVLWGFIIQRLQPDHSCDAAVCHLDRGAADDLDRADALEEPLWQRLSPIKFNWVKLTKAVSGKIIRSRFSCLHS